MTYKTTQLPFKGTYNNNHDGNNANEAATEHEETTTSTKCPNTNRRNCLGVQTKQDWARMIILSRSCFLISMAIAAAVCGFVSYKITFQTQEEVAITTYESIASAAIAEAAAISQRKQQGGKVLSSMLSHAFPSASQWPSAIGLPGYIDIATNVAQQSSTSGHAFAVIVKPDQVEEFERNAQQLYSDLGYPKTAGFSDEFGFGIYGMKPKPNATPGEMMRFHDVSGKTNWNNTNDIMVPFLQHSVTYKNPAVLMRNVYQIESRGAVLDRIIKCAENYIIANANQTITESPTCACVTDFIKIFIKPGPAAVFLYPVFPEENKTTVVGFIGTSIHWEEILTDIVPDYVDGLQGVISQANGEKSFTYNITKGQPKLVGEGDLHDPAYESYGKTVELNPDTIRTGRFKHSYELTLYPTKVMFAKFQSSEPAFVSIGFIAVIVVCTMIFFLYDFFMRTASNERQRILEIKRRFVRFVSHEIRTPLNVVKMGLELLQGEIRDGLEDEEEQAALVNNRRNPTTSRTDGTIELYTTTEEEEIHKSISSSSKADDESKNNNSASRLPDWIDLTGDLMENAQNAVSILDDLLNYDKIESGTFKIEHSTDINLDKLLGKVVSDFSIQARNKNISLDLVESSSSSSPANKMKTKLYVVGDMIRLTQAIRNILSNAIKFSPESIGKIKVTKTYNPLGLPDVSGTPEVTKDTKGRLLLLRRKNQRRKKSATISDAVEKALVRTRAGSMTIRITDNGAGLSKEQLALLFNEGMQFDANKLQAGGGSGLGLCITKEIILHHRGTIHATSDGLGAGTTFTIELPLFKSQGESSMLLIDDGVSTSNTHTSLTTTSSIGIIGNPEATTTKRSMIETKKQKQSHHILVVDDALSNTKLLVRLLERAGHTCQVAMNGQEAVDAYIQNKMDCCCEGSSTTVGDNDDGNDTKSCQRLLFDTILIDNLMPVLDGPAATKQLRKLDCQAHIIGITGNVMAEDVSFFKECGADEVLPKPVKLSEIEEIWGEINVNIH